MKKWIIGALIALGLVYAVSNSNITADAVNGINAVKKEFGVSSANSIPKESGEMFVYFCPKERCDLVLEDLVSRSSSVECAVHEINLKGLIAKLKEKNARVIVDNKYSCEGIERCKRDNRNALMHNKFCTYMIDGEKWVSTGSMNPTESCAFANDNNLFVARSNHMYDNFKDEFEEMWGGVFGKGNKVRYPKINHDSTLIEQGFCPEDDCRGKLHELIDSAKESVWFMAFSFTDDKIGNLLAEKKDEVKIIGLFEKSQAGSQYSEYWKLKNAGVEVYLDTNPKFMHEKVFVVDGESVYFGSVNPTASGFENNDENFLIIRNVDLSNQFVEDMNEKLSF